MIKNDPQVSKTEKFKNQQLRQKNKTLRTREYLTSQEVENLRKSASSIGRYGHRDSTMILLMFRHALRVGELVSLKWVQADLTQGLLHVRRLKNGIPSTHPLRGPELRALKTLRRANPHGEYIFMSERKAPLTERSVRIIVARAGKKSALGMSIHPHMLRHSTGFYLANQGHDTRAIQSYMGHSNIRNTTIYTELSTTRFNNFWGD